jgi:hypothetical protein
MIRTLLAAFVLCSATTAARAQPGPLAPLAFLEGCWIGTFDEPGAPRDERCFTFANGGRHLRDVHTVVDAGYSGETIYAWDAAARQIVVAYFANDGGLMHGVVSMSGETLSIPDARYVSPNGEVQHLRSRWVRQAEGFVTETEREEGGVWRPLMRITYARAHIGE